MRGLPLDIVNLIATRRYSQAYLFELYLKEHVVRLCSHTRPIEYNSNIFYSTGTLLSFNSITESVTGEITGADIELSGITEEARSLIESEGRKEGVFNNKVVKVYNAFFNENDSLIGVVLFYSGVTSGASISENIMDTDLKTEVLSIRTIPEWGNFEKRVGRQSNNSAHKLKFPNDDVFKDVSALANTELQWG